MKIYQEALKFKNKYTGTGAWRIKKQSKIAEMHIKTKEKVKNVFKN